jgi:flagellar basal-body rod protein FlgG
MPKGVYAAASAMFVENQALDVAARNLAHATTTGYRRETAFRQGFDQALADQGRTGGVKGNGGTGVLSQGSAFSFQEGSRETTSGTYDLAISGEGFFRVTKPDGDTLLTRAGHFQTDPKGRLVTPEGFLVQGQGGSITIPGDAEGVTIDPKGRVSIATTAAGVRTEQVIDQIRLVRVERPEAMRAINGQYFDPGDAPQSDASAQVHHGSLEKSNVEPLRELVDMIAIQRRYDAAQKAMREQTTTGQGFTELLRGNA